MIIMTKMVYNVQKRKMSAKLTGISVFTGFKSSQRRME